MEYTQIYYIASTTPHNPNHYVTLLPALTHIADIVHQLLQQYERMILGWYQMRDVSTGSCIMEIVYGFFTNGLYVMVFLSLVSEVWQESNCVFVRRFLCPLGQFCIVCENVQITPTKTWSLCFNGCFPGKSFCSQ